ncbi:MAG: type IV toxin-antitoxin system AbiEi family antitoxin domain-containing protein [Anaerolineaceae bacterium]|nr:type IV toxin-antitoxin system AbiEi family antitoxin domain-containing protein [Anaerolineaceae bacterium]
MIVKNKLSPIGKIRKILKNQGGTLVTSDLARENIPRTYLSILEKKGEIEQVSRGVYKEVAAIEDELLSFQSKYKASVYSHETALFFHDLTDRSPMFFSISVPVGYHSISLNNSGHKIFYVNRKLFNVGIILMKSPHGNTIKATNLERTICDILRSRNQIDGQLINDAMKRYVGNKEKNLDLLFDYAKQFRIQKVVREYIEVLL